MFIIDQSQNTLLLKHSTELTATIRPTTALFTFTGMLPGQKAREYNQEIPQSHTAD